MPLSSKLDRTLRAVDDSSDGEDYYEVTDRSSSASVIETGAGGDVVSSEDGEDIDNDNGDDEARMSSVSFAVLAKAQHVLEKEQSADRKRKRGQDTSKSQDDKLEALRERLRQIKAEKLANGAKSGKKAESTKKSRNVSNPVTEQHDDQEEEDHSDDGNNSSDSDGAPKARPSKHAPAVQSSKRMVSRKRTVVDVKKPVFRDPRFDNMGGAKPDDHVLDTRYSFLKDYRASEIAQLRATIKKTKNEAEKEKLKKKLLSMESQQKSREAKEKQQEIVREHKKKEKELVKQGKQPYFLKKCEYSLDNLCHSKQHWILTLFQLSKRS